MGHTTIRYVRARETHLRGTSICGSDLIRWEKLQVASERAGTVSLQRTHMQHTHTHIRIHVGRSGTCFGAVCKLPTNMRRGRERGASLDPCPSTENATKHKHKHDRFDSPQRRATAVRQLHSSHTHTLISWSVAKAGNEQGSSEPGRKQGCAPPALAESSVDSSSFRSACRHVHVRPLLLTRLACVQVQATLHLHRHSRTTRTRTTPTPTTRTSPPTRPPLPSSTCRMV